MQRAATWIREEGILANKGAVDRRSERVRVVLVGMIECGNALLSVRIANLSAHGALVTGDGLPGRDTDVIVRCKGLRIRSRVAWTQAPHAGIQFDHPIRPEDLLPNAPGRPPMIIRDTRELNFRRPGFRGNQMTEEERKLVEEWTRPPESERAE